jgi:hypothetical protein
LFASRVSGALSPRRSSLKKLADENANLLTMLAGLPTLKNAVANMPPPPQRPHAFPDKPLPGEVCALCGTHYAERGGAHTASNAVRSGAADGADTLGVMGGAGGAAAGRGGPTKGSKPVRGRAGGGLKVAGPNPTSNGVGLEVGSAEAAPPHTEAADAAEAAALRAEVAELRAENARLLAAAAKMSGAALRSDDKAYRHDGHAVERVQYKSSFMRGGSQSGYRPGNAPTAPPPRAVNNGSQSARATLPPPPKPPAQPHTARASATTPSELALVPSQDEPYLRALAAGGPLALSSVMPADAGAPPDAAAALAASAEAPMEPPPPQRVPPPKDAGETLGVVYGDASYGRRVRPGGLHSGVDELGFSTAWRTQPLEHLEPRRR